VLEPLRIDHADELAPVLDHRAMHEFTGGRPSSVEELRARFARQVIGRSPDGDERWLNWVVRLRSTSAAVGFVQASVVQSDGETVAVLAWVIGVPYQGQGLAKEAATLMVQAISPGQGVRLRAHIHPEHRASIAVAEALGMSPTDLAVDGETRWEGTSPKDVDAAHPAKDDGD
jgi:RimJ/RimL family protein N-acetyltransferase